MTILELVKGVTNLESIKGMPPHAAPSNVISIEMIYPFKSMNFAHSASGKSHWKERKSVVDKAESTILNKLLPYRAFRIEQYTLDVVYNSKIDPVNVAYAAKMFEDACGYLKIIRKDDKRYNRGFSITPDDNLKHNTYIFVLKRI